MTETRAVVEPFRSFGLADADPAWSSASLDAAIGRALSPAGTSTDDLLRGVFELLAARTDLTKSHAHFVRDFVKAIVRRLGPDLGKAELGWLIEAARAKLAPAQALLAAYLIPKSRLVPEAVLSILEAVQTTTFFDEAVIELQDAAVRSDVARHVFATKPEIAKRVRSVLTR